MLKLGAGYLNLIFWTQVLVFALFCLESGAKEAPRLNQGLQWIHFPLTKERTLPVKMVHEGGELLFVGKQVVDYAPDMEVILLTARDRDGDGHWDLWYYPLKNGGLGHREYVSYSADGWDGFELFYGPKAENPLGVAEPGTLAALWHAREELFPLARSGMRSVEREIRAREKDLIELQVSIFQMRRTGVDMAEIRMAENLLEQGWRELGSYVRGRAAPILGLAATAEGGVTILTLGAIRLMGWAARGILESSIGSPVKHFLQNMASKMLGNTMVRVGERVGVFFLDSNSAVTTSGLGRGALSLLSRGGIRSQVGPVLARALVGVSVLSLALKQQATLGPPMVLNLDEPFGDSRLAAVVTPTDGVILNPDHFEGREAPSLGSKLQEELLVLTLAAQPDQGGMSPRGWGITLSDPALQRLRQGYELPSGGLRISPVFSDQD